MTGTRRRGPALLVAAAGGLLATGALLPWVSFYAGLVNHSGLRGPYGRILLVAGVLLVLVGLGQAIRGRQLPSRPLAVLGVALAVITGWLAAGLMETRTMLATEPLLVGAVGPGIPVAVAGTLLFLLAILAGRRWHGVPHRGG
ncbi:MAG TPA: hypothetical protein VMK53_06515 [Gemmatimonadales bacterium]|nr:hypothetical protein [Gemmatimonadales bacterium]